MFNKIRKHRFLKYFLAEVDKRNKNIQGRVPCPIPTNERARKPFLSQSESLGSSQSWWLNIVGGSNTLWWRCEGGLTFIKHDILKKTFSDKIETFVPCVLCVCLETPSDADKRLESKINAKQIIFVYRGKRSEDPLSQIFTRRFQVNTRMFRHPLTWLFERYFQTFIPVFVARIYDQTTRFIDIVQTIF